MAHTFNKPGPGACTDCHTEESGGDWARYADDNDLKRTARRMMLMVDAINRTLHDIFASDERVRAMVLMVGGAHDIPPAALMLPQLAASDPRLAVAHRRGRAACARRGRATRAGRA